MRRTPSSIRKIKNVPTSIEFWEKDKEDEFGRQEFNRDCFIRMEIGGKVRWFSIMSEGHRGKVWERDRKHFLKVETAQNSVDGE